jgi:hypothetical protein
MFRAIREFGPFANSIHSRVARNIYQHIYRILLPANKLFRDSYPDIMERQSDVERIIRYHFTNPQLLAEAFEAAGVSELHKGGNKRLALVGDALIRLAILDGWFPSGASTSKSICLKLE